MDLAKHIKPFSGEKNGLVWKRKICDLSDYHEGALDVIDSKVENPYLLEVGASEENIKKHTIKSNLYQKANSYAKTMLTSSITDEVYQKDASDSS